ncbi:hypothetical protein UlMin_038614 [Ulmus minor]
MNLTNSNSQFQNDTKNHLKSIENQFSQLATTVGRLEAQGSGKLPSQTVINPKENASAISLRSGKTLDEAHKEPVQNGKEKYLSIEKDDATTSKEDTPPRKVISNPSIPINVSSLPFPSRFATTKKEEHEKEILETFRKVQVNIPLLDAIKQVPRYAKFLKELCTNKRKLKGNEIVNFGENVSAVSNTYPKGVLEDVLVQVNEMVFPADFYVIDMCEDANSKAAPLLLGRPFMKTARTKIDVHNGTLTMEFDGESISFNIFEAMRYPKYKGNIHMIESIKELMAEFETLPPIAPRYDLFYIELPLSNNKPLPSIMQAPTLELKALPNHLKYIYLGEGETLPVIVARNLSSVQEDKLIRVLRDHKTAIGWTIADIKGISSSMCMHRILLEEDAKPTREAQRRLNPPMMEVVKKEIIKLLDVGIIYPISDSKWVSPVQVVPKKSGITVVKSKDDNLVPTRIQTGWRVCIDYRKLNTTTRKDHFPLPFIDQMLERLAGHTHYCFLDGFSGSFFSWPCRFL